MLTEIRGLISSPFKMENEGCKNALLLGLRCCSLKSQWIHPQHPPPVWIYHSLNYLTCIRGCFANYCVLYDNKQLLYVMNLSVQPEKQDSSLAPDVQRWTAHALIGQVNGVMGFDLLLLWTRITSLGSQRKSSSKSGDVK